MSTDVGVQVSSLAPQRRSKVRFAPALSISRGIESTIRSAPLLLLSKSNPCYALGFDLAMRGFGRHILRSDDFSYRTIVTSRSFCRRSSQSRTHLCWAPGLFLLQSPLCSGAFYFTGNRKHHPFRSLAPPFQIEPVLCTGLRFGDAGIWTSYPSQRRFFLQNNRHFSLILSPLLPIPDPLVLGSGFVFTTKSALLRRFLFMAMKIHKRPRAFVDFKLFIIHF